MSLEVLKSFIANNQLAAIGLTALLGGTLYYFLKKDKTFKLPEIRDYDASKVYVFVFAKSNLGLPSPSPYILKVITFLEYHNIPYKLIPTSNMGPRHKLPYAVIDGKVVSDSQIIIQTLQKKFNIVDDVSDPLELAEMNIIRRFMDDCFMYNNVGYARWVDPAYNMPMIRLMFPRLPAFIQTRIQKHQNKIFYIQGTGRYTPDEIYEMSYSDISSLSTRLGDKRFFFGTEKLTVGDITVFAHLAQLYFIEMDTQPRLFLLKHQNLVKFIQDVKTIVFGESNTKWDSFSAKQ
eukprot:gene3137-3921_t